jgi:copper(I)-binding protein
MEKSLKKGESLFKESDSGALWCVMRGAIKNLLSRITLGAFFSCLMCSPVHAHDFKVGDITVDHPYAIPTVATQATGAVYFRNLRNRGVVPDRLVSAHTPVAARVGLHRMQMEGDVMRMREVSAVELPAKSDVRMRHASTDGYHLMLEGLKAPLKDGDSFPLTLRFEKAGERTVQIHVQTPRKGTAQDHKH